MGLDLLGSPQRDLAGEEPSAARPIGEHQRAAGIDARDLAHHRRAIGKQELHWLPLIRMAVLPLRRERREAVLRILAKRLRELGDEAREQAIAAHRVPRPT